MPVVTWLTSFRRGLTSKGQSLSPYLCNAADFRHAAYCERLRVDRNGSVLALLVIQLPPGRSATSDVEYLGQLLHSRLRMTDTAGLLASGDIGVLLPDTNETGAWKVAADICDYYSAGRDRPACDVYLYPGKQEGDGDLFSADVDENEVVLSEGKVPRSAIENLFLRAPSPAKRFIDVVGASLGLLAVAPLLAVAALAIKATSPGSVIFRQEREGIGGRRFVIYKLRTMRHDADQRQEELRALSVQDGPAFKMWDDPRVTGVGRWLRRTSIDELPQLWNVLRGDMSLVGPRPLPTSESRKCVPWQQQRLSVLPGLTCIWQVHGRNLVPFDDWVRMDIRYVRRQCLWCDLRLLVATPPAILLSGGPR